MSTAPDMKAAITLEALRYEYDTALGAVIESDEQVRSMTALLERAQHADSDIRPPDACKIVGATLALNARLLDQVDRARKALALAEVRGRRSADAAD